MIVNVEAVEERRDTLINSLEKEEKEHGGYEKWYSSLEMFRKSLRSYYRFSIGGKSFRTKTTTVASGDIIDHHIISYLAPLEYKGVGWGGELRSPGEQIKMLWHYLKKRGTRLIYVPLPNKSMIYPELITEQDEILNNGCNAPQYRKILKEIVWGGVEVIDIYPLFIEKREKVLFSRNHNISSQGAKIVADAITEYIVETTLDLPHMKEFKLSLEDRAIYQPGLTYPFIEKGFSVCDEAGLPYWNQRSDESKIAVFGDCNLQGYQETGCGIAANLAYRLQYPVYNAGRFLPFDYWDSITSDFLERLFGKELVIYVAFLSASFVRSATMSSLTGIIKRRRLRNRWSTLEL